MEKYGGGEVLGAGKPEVEFVSQNSLRHIAIIMDGNNRWARRQGLPGPAGHKAGVERIRDVMRVCQQHDVEVLTLFAFSSENWRRPPKEVDALMTLFLTYLKKEAKKLHKEGVRLRVIGNREQFSQRINRAIEAAESIASEGKTTLVIAADYGGRWDIASAAKELARQAASGNLDPEDITEEMLHQHTALSDLPAPDLLIRTGGELRISNFLLWQSAYTELYFSEDYWPDFNDTKMSEAIAEFYKRQRRFGYSQDQVSSLAGGAN